MKIYYKTKEIDYEKTLGELSPGEYVIIPTSDRDLANIRVNVSRALRRMNEGVSFTVNKSINGAIIRRIA